MILLTFIFLIICSAALVFFQSLSKDTLASVSEYPVWIVKSPEGSSNCLGFCDLEMFSDRLCTSNGDTSDTWHSVKLFDQFNDHTNKTWTDCSSNWTSPCSSSTLKSQHVSACGVNDASKIDWIGFEFESKQQARSTPHLVC